MVEKTLVEERDWFYSNISFEQFIKLAPLKLQERVNNLVNVDQRQDYHPEGNVYNHEKIVFNRLQRWHNGDINMLLIALFHDIGKDKTTKPQPRHGKWLVAYGHERVSAKCVEKYREWIEQMGGDFDFIYQMVLDHMRPNVYNQMKPQKKKAMQEWPHFDDLMAFHKADKMGTDWEKWLNITHSGK